VLRVGLTGGIACGKTRVRRCLGEAGLHTLDLDEVAHRLSAPGGAAHGAVVSAFGPEILLPDGSIDRKKLGGIVFADPAARAALNDIVHPLVREEEALWAASFAQEAGAVLVTDAALLVEAGMHLRFDRLIVVHCDPAEQVRRLVARDGIREEDARARLRAQMPIAEKRRFAHYEVDTSGALDDTDAAAFRLAEELRAVVVPQLFELPAERALACLAHGPQRGPRGLGPVTLLREIASARGLEMERLFRRLDPPAPGPWYRAADDDRVPPETLEGALVVWALARGGPDTDFLAAAAASLARLTHRDPSHLAAAVYTALALLAAAVAGTVAGDDTELAARAARWGGTEPPEHVRRTLNVAAAHPRDPERASEAAAAVGLDSRLAAALVGIASGGGAGLPSDLADVVREVRAGAPRR
jgi:dephospho-CoA kinase